MAWEIETVYSLNDADLFAEISLVGWAQFLWAPVAPDAPGYAKYLDNLESFTVPNGATSFTQIQFDSLVYPMPTWLGTKARFFDYVAAVHLTEVAAVDLVRVINALATEQITYIRPARTWAEVVVEPSDQKKTWAQMKAKAVQLLTADATGTPLRLAKNAVLNAMLFGKDLMAEYGGKNILRGYTTAQVKELALSLNGIQALLVSGSLYSALEEIENFTPTALVTQQDVDEFSQKIRDYLGI